MNPEHLEQSPTSRTVKHPTTRQEAQRLQDLARMLRMGISQGYTVDECIQAVHTEARLAHGNYDRWGGWKQYSTIETLFASRRLMHKRAVARSNTAANK